MKVFLSPHFSTDSYLFDILPKNEIYGVLAGTKPVALKDIDKIDIQGNGLHRQLEEVKSFFKKQGIYYAITQNHSTFCGSLNHKILVYSKNKELLDYTLQNFSKETFSVGIVLGYPDCCVGTSYDSKSPQERIFDSKTFSYLTNDIASYESVPAKFLSPELHGKLAKYFKYFFGGFLTWSPCSYDCDETISKLKKLELFIKKIDPKYSEFVTARTKKNYLFIDKGNWVSFDIHLSQKKSCIDIFEGIIFDKELEKLLNLENLFSIEDNFVSIYSKTGELVRRMELEKEVFYLSFT